MDSTEQLTDTPLISIIVPCYNQAQFLNEALDSVLVQTYTNWECIIINDGSTDSTADIANGYCKKEQRFRYINKDNGGLPGARNAGIRQSTGQYILPLDCDDRIGPRYLELAMEVFKQTPDISLVYSKAKLFGIKNQIWELRPYNYTELLKSNMIFCSAIFEKTAFETAGGYDEQLKTGYEDWDLYIQLLNSESKVHQLNDVHFYYRIKTRSMFTSIDFTTHQELNHYLYRKHQTIYKAYFDNPIDMISKIDLLEIMYKNSTDYKLGNYLLSPLRVVLKTLKSVIKDKNR